MPNQLRKTPETELTKLLDCPAHFCTHFTINIGEYYIRLTFGESINESHGPTWRFAVVLPVQQALGLADGLSEAVEALGVAWRGGMAVQ